MENSISPGLPEFAGGWLGIHAHIIPLKISSRSRHSLSIFQFD
jgi:hypothetical protein